MEHEVLREDKTCLNCCYVVEKNYCPNCGQENTETRKTFHHLFTHFVEDLVHYDGAFWISIKYLLFDPARLTKEYLVGKRKKFVPPVKLYIFINFLTFFLLSILPSNKNDSVDVAATKNQQEIAANKKLTRILRFSEYNSVRELDSVEALKPESEKLSPPSYWIEKRLAKSIESTTPEEYNEKFRESIIHNLPKALFIYMPFFALALWLFHGKKRWYYFDHGIFTLHYFCFLLLTFSCFMVLNSITGLINESLHIITILICILLLTVFWIFYFFRSHSKFYGERKLISRIKGLGLFVMNLFFLILLVIGLMLYSVVNIN